VTESPDRILTWFDARDAVVSAVLSHGRRGTATVGVDEAVGRTVASPVLSPTDVPHYTSSAMDGYAVRGAGPWRLLAAPVEGPAGRNIHRAGGTLGPGEALPVLTGSLLPDGAEAVVRSEDAEVTCDGRILHAAQPEPGRDIRPAGQERSAGSLLVEPGTRLTARHVAMLCTAGVDTVEVTRGPQVVCAFTGNEVVHSGVPGPGEVRDAFSVSFPALLRSWGSGAVTTESVADDPVAVEYLLRRPSTLDADIVVVTGGSGHSGQDFARRFITRSVRDAGADGQILSTEVRCRPGHPTLLARRGSQLIVGAPGNPFAAHVALHSFVAPAVAAFIAAGTEGFEEGTADGTGTAGAGVPGAGTPEGRDAVTPSTLFAPAALSTGVCAVELPPLNRDRIRLVPARIGADGVCSPVAGAHSHMLTGYATGDVLLVVPASGLAAGAEVQFLRL
jgi:molybdopterin molybdotransferase